MTEPNDCPFCEDTDPELMVVDGFYYVECDCGARGPVFSDETITVEDNKERAIEAWNNA